MRASLIITKLAVQYFTAIPQEGCQDVLKQAKLLFPDFNLGLLEENFQIINKWQEINDKKKLLDVFRRTDDYIEHFTHYVFEKSKNNKRISVSLPNKRQEIFVGKDLSDWIIGELLAKEYSGFVIFCDTNFAKIYKDLLIEFKEKLKPLDVILVEPSEDSKSLNFLNSSLARCTEANFNRKGCFVVLGGGIVEI